MGTYTEQYVYDAVGNFTRMQHRGSLPINAGWTSTYDYAETSLIETGTAGTLLKTSNRLSSTQLSAAGPAAPYHYDLHGNTTFMQHLSGGGNDPNLGWDYADRLRQADRDLGAFYVYDSSGQRVRKIWRKSAGLTEERIYLGGSEIFRSYPGPITNSDPALECETLHVMDDRRRVALVETRTLGNDAAPRQLIRYQHDNHLGSVSVELDADAQIISYEEYAPYGSSTYQAMATETPKRYRYTGKERDEETGFTYHGARFYAPWIARWVSADPSGTRSGINLYLYVAANPARLVDDDGMDPKPSFGEALTKGLLEGGKVVLFHTPVSPLRIVGDVQTIKQMVDNFSEEYKQSGSIGKGPLRATDVVNPAYHAGTEAFETREAVDKGKYGAAAAHGTLATFHAVSTVLLAVGGARALAAPKAPITPPPALEPPTTTTPAVPKPALEPAGQAAPAVSEGPPPGTQLSLFPDEVPPSVAPETLAGEAGGAPPREIPFDIDIAEVKSSKWSAQRALDYQGKFIFTEGLDLSGGVQGAIRYTPNNTLLVNLAELGGMEKPIGGTYELALDPLEVQQATAGLKFGSSAYGNALEGIAVRRVAKATGQTPVIRPAQQGGADFLPQQTRFRVLGF
jgi:RHS repeat-associated protein